MFKHYQKGFSLLEAIVAISVIGVMGFVVAAVITRSFKASDKTQLLGLVKQNGQNALNILESSIRNSQEVACISTSNDVITVLKKEGKKDNILLRFSLANDAIRQDEPDITEITIPDFKKEDLCNLAHLPLKNDVYLTDNNASTGVKVENLKFTTDSSGNNKSITIYFTIKPQVSGADYSRQLGQGSESFQTTVYVR